MQGVLHVSTFHWPTVLVQGYEKNTPRLHVYVLKILVSAACRWAATFHVTGSFGFGALRSARCLCSNVGLGSVQAWLLVRSVAQGIPIGPKVYCDYRRITTVRHVLFSFFSQSLDVFLPQCLIDLEDGQMTINTVEHAAIVCDLSLDWRCQVSLFERPDNWIRYDVPSAIFINMMSLLSLRT